MNFEQRLLKAKNDIKVKRLIRQIYDVIDRLESLPRLEKEVKEALK